MDRHEKCPHCLEETDKALKDLMEGPDSDCCQNLNNHHHQEAEPKSTWKKFKSLFQKND